MKKYNYPWENGRARTGKCALALGFFDGIHAAHRDLIKTAKAEADAIGLPLGIFTFRSDTAIKSGAKRIYSEQEKHEILESLGADFVISADFDKIKDISPEDFIKHTLFCDIECRLCIAGFNFRFGRGALGDAEMLVKLMRECGGDAVIKKELCIEGETVSATLIRALIERGDTEKANLLLGAPYFISGVAVHGRSIGTSLGYPTVNTELARELVVPRRGVYLSAVKADGRLFTALTNIGTCPTFDERAEHAETYILDFSSDLYGESLKIYLLDFLREERRFSSPDELKNQIKSDIDKAKKRKDSKKWQVLGQNLP